MGREKYQWNRRGIRNLYGPDESWQCEADKKGRGDQIEESK